MKIHVKTWRDATHQTVYAHIHAFTSLSNTFDLMTDQICFLGSVWSALSEYHIRFYVRPSESTVWISFWNYSCSTRREPNKDIFGIKLLGYFLKVVHKIWCDILKEQIKVILEIIYFLAIGLKAAHYCDENTEFIKKSQWASTREEVSINS